MMKHHLLIALAGVGLASGSVMSTRAGRGSEPRPAQPGVSQPRIAEQEPEWRVIAQRFGGTMSDTKPSKDAPMSFTIPVEIREVLVQTGQAVKAGQVLIRARDDEQQAVVEGQKIAAENRARIDNAMLQKELADHNYQRIQEADRQGSANPSEVVQRRIEAAAAAVAVRQENTTHELEKKRLVQAQGLLARYRLEAQFDGVIEEVRVDPGQGVRESDPVLRLVNIEKLKLDVWAPTQETIRLGLKPGSRAWVLVALPDKPLYVEGRVKAVSPVANSVAQTRRVEVELDNPEGWPAGLPAMVRFTPPSPDFDDHKLTPGAKSTAAGASTVPSVSDAR